MITLPVGKTAKLAPKWSSANDAVATVNPQGLVKAVGLGTVEIYCSIGDEIAAIRTVKVEEPHPIPKATDEGAES